MQYIPLMCGCLKPEVLLCGSTFTLQKTHLKIPNLLHTEPRPYLFLVGSLLTSLMFSLKLGKFVISFAKWLLKQLKNTRCLSMF